MIPDNDFSKATIWVAFFIFFIFIGTAASENPSAEIKSLWVVRYSMVSKKEIDRVIETAVEYGFNHLFVQVRGRGDAYYSSQIVPRGHYLSDPDFDPLAYAIEKGHSEGLQVHAWLNTFLVWSSPEMPSDSNHVIRTHPEWIDEPGHQTGSDIHYGNGNDGIPRFLSPAVEGVIDHLKKILVEILDHYPVDGIHLDYVRLADLDYGFHPDAQGHFEEAYSIRPFDIKNGDNEEIRYLRSEWERLRRESVTDFLRQYSQVIMEKKPDCLLSVAVKPDPSVAKYRYFQEWDEWLTEGLVDYVVPMNYATEMDDFQSNLQSIERTVQGKYNRSIIIGVAIYNQSPEAAAEKLKILSTRDFAGFSVFSWDALKDSILSKAPFLESVKSYFSTQD